MGQNIVFEFQRQKLPELLLRTQCLKITEKVAFNIASEASYVNILSRQKLIKNAKNSQFWRVFENLMFTVTSKRQNSTIYRFHCFRQTSILRIWVILSQISKVIYEKNFRLWWPWQTWKKLWPRPLNNWLIILQCLPPVANDSTFKNCKSPKIYYCEVNNLDNDKNAALIWCRPWLPNKREFQIRH